MLLITTERIPGKEIELLGMVRGSTIQAKNIGRDIGSGFKAMIGGELQSYTAMLDDARDIATQRMTAQAQSMGANAIIGIRYTTSSVMQGAAEICAYGTAVKFL